jgi:GGDEF domain-containing protein
MKFGCGIATFPYDGLELEDLIKLSDKRMYEDKERIKYHELHYKS